MHRDFDGHSLLKQEEQLGLMKSAYKRGASVTQLTKQSKNLEGLAMETEIQRKRLMESIAQAESAEKELIEKINCKIKAI